MKCAIKVYNSRVMPLGFDSRLSVEDLVQQGSLTWLRSLETFDPDVGVKFSTYLHRALLTNLGRYIEYQCNMKNGFVPRMQFLDAPLSDDEDGGSLYEILQDTDTADATSILEANETVILLRRSLSPLAQAMFDLYIDPPEWLTQEYVATRAQARMQSRLEQSGRERRPPDELMVLGDILGRLWNLSGNARKNMVRDVRRIL